MEKKKLYIIDGTSLCYRSFYAIKLSTGGGFPTGAVYGFYTTLRKLTKKVNPLYMAVCFDVSRKTFRQKKFKEYKIQRPPPPDNLTVQIPLIRQLVKHLGMIVIEKEGFEADDVIASLVRRALHEHIQVMIVTSDKDMFQLLDKKNVHIYDPAKDKIYKEETFIEEYKFSPEHIVDFLALVGDAADNVPGAKGIGKVSATKLITEYGSLGEIFNNVDVMPQKTRDILITQKDTIILSKELATLAYPELSIAWEDLKIKRPAYSALYKMFKELEFKSLLKDIPAPSFDTAVDVTEGISPDILERARERGECVISFDGEKFYLLGEKESQVRMLSGREAEPILSDKGIKKIAYNCKQLLTALKGEVSCENIWFDVGVASYLVNPGLLDFSLENITAHFLNKFIKGISPCAAPHFIFNAYKVLREELKRKKLEKLFFDVEMPLVEVLADIESWGIKIDKEYLSSFAQEVDRMITQVREKIYIHAGKHFNLNSPKQLSKVLFADLGIRPLKRTKTGFSTNEEVLRKLAKEYPIAALLLEYRELSKLHSTYLIPFLKEVEKGKGNVYAQFNQTKTLTGRLSSSSPNLQNIPARSELGQKFRKAFISSFGEGVILSCDYSQIELRILAHFSQDKTLISAFAKDADIHASTASILFGVAEEEVSLSQREAAKRVNFGIIYGMSPYGLSRELSLSLGEAEAFIEGYFLRYPAVKRFIDKTICEVQEKGFVRTLLGRIRYFENNKTQRQDEQEFIRRQAVNTPIQGSAADVIKTAMVAIFREFKKCKLLSRMILQIHDELVFDVKKEELSLVRRIAQEKMEHAIELRVPLKVNVKAGRNWLDMKEI